MADVLLGYMRVSKSDGIQTLDLQRDALLAAGVKAGGILLGSGLGRLDARPGLVVGLKVLQPGNTLVVWKLDRLGRDLKHLVTTADNLRTRGVGFKVLTGAGAQIDTTTNGPFFFAVIAAFAAFERELIAERTRAGPAAARARGCKVGRPRKMDRAEQPFVSGSFAAKLVQDQIIYGEPVEPGIVSTGNEGLDVILTGGLPADRLYLLEGAPGSGKTTLALQFLREGIRQGERVLYITLSETREELAAVAASHGFDLSAFEVFEFEAAAEVLGGDRDQSVLNSWEMELGETIDLIKAEVERVRPARVVFDSLSEMRLLAQDPLRYRRQVLALKQFFVGRKTTVLLVDDLSGAGNGRDDQLHSLAHGVITLERLTLDFGAARRRLQVQKLRGVDFVAGYHDFVIRRGGLDIFPRLIAARHQVTFAEGQVSSGIAALDALLAGGPLRGTSVLLTGPAGTGKTTLALQYLHAACERGEPCTIYEFDERVSTLLTRARAFGLDLVRHVESGRLVIQQIDPAEISPGEFTMRVRRDVEGRTARMVVIDSLNDYLAAMPQEQQLILQMHELLSYLNQQGVVTFLINPQQGLMGTVSTNSLNISYIADVVVLLRFFEAGGRLRKAISVLKNRGGPHEDAIRELRIDLQGIRVGEPLVQFRGVLTGTPEYVGDQVPLMEDRPGGA